MNGMRSMTVRGFAPSPFQGEGWGEGAMLARQPWAGSAFTLTCSAHAGPQAGIAQRARRMRLETPASPPALSLEGRGSKTKALARRQGAPRPRVKSGYLPSRGFAPSPFQGEGWGEGAMLARQPWAGPALTLTCSAHAGPQAGIAQRPRRVRLEPPASPPALSLQGRGGKTKAHAPGDGRGGRA